MRVVCRYTCEARGQLVGGSLWIWGTGVKLVVTGGRWRTWPCLSLQPSFWFWFLCKTWRSYENPTEFWVSKLSLLPNILLYTQRRKKKTHRISKFHVINKGKNSSWFLFLLKEWRDLMGLVAYGAPSVLSPTWPEPNSDEGRNHLYIHYAYQTAHPRYKLKNRNRSHESHLQRQLSAECLRLSWLDF